MASDAQPHVALLAFPFASHPAALFALARALAAAAPGAAFSFLSFPRSLATLAPAAAALGNLRLCPLDDGFPSPPPESVLDQIDLFLRAAPGNLREGLASAAAGAGGLPVSCVVSDAFLWMVAEVAEGMGVPWVPLWAGGISSLSAHIHTDLLRRTIGVGEQAIPAKAEETLHFIPGLSATRVRDLPEGIVFGDLDSVFSRLLHRMGKEVTRATALVSNSFEGLEPAIDADLKATFKEYLPVGPISLLNPPAVAKDDESSSLCLTWLDRQGPATVAYISFSTIMSLPTAELVELAEALEATAIPFLWSMKEQLRRNLPAGFLERTRGQGLMVSWAPQVQVLGHPAVGAFVTHCGWNSVMESIASGVPMLCRPIFGDHMMAERVITKVLRTGVGFEGRALTREAAVSSLNMIFKEEEGKKIRERACEAKAKATTAVKPDGSSAKNFNRLLEIVCGHEMNPMVS